MSINEIKIIHTRRQAERTVLGSVLASPALLDAPELAALQLADFGAEGYRQIWRAIRALRAESRFIVPEDVRAEMERAGAVDLSELAGIATARDLATALADLLREAMPEQALADAISLRHGGQNLQLADRLDELSDVAKGWPPTTRSFFCEALDALAAMFCAPLAGAH